MRIDDARPIWIQLVDDFRVRIVSGQWPPGSRIPSERELATQAGVNATDTYIAAVAALGMDLAQVSAILAERWAAHGTPTQGEAP